MRKIDVMIIVTFVLIVFALAFVFRAYGEQIELKWDPVETAEGYYIFQSQKDSTFHYDIPVVTDQFPDGKIPQNVTSLVVDLTGIDGQDTRYRFVARAFRGDEQSADSNEVSYVVSRVAPPAATELSGAYDISAGSIKLRWSQPAEDEEWRTIDHWSVYYRIRGTEEWTLVGTVEAGGELKLETPFNAVAEGEQNDVEFVIVSYRRSGVFSANSETLLVNVDREGVDPVENLRIDIEIPVE